MPFSMRDGVLVVRAHALQKHMPNSALANDKGSIWHRGLTPAGTLGPDFQKILGQT